MYCLKCGKEIAEEQVFCPDCLAVMEAYPVKPDTVVHIPQRAPHTPEKRHRTVSPKEQIYQLQKTVRWLMLTATVLMVVLLLTVAMLLHQLDKPSSPGGLPLGQNYTTFQQQE
ncbi:MAG: zinc ribbon domain-containing protein [Oscillospiraceae bacterium]|nr:zinc ribbon domain-containing protein [Oscillospiraceae bacterium]